LAGGVEHGGGSAEGVGDDRIAVSPAEIVG
jgi:hypothetical protein